MMPRSDRLFRMVLAGLTTAVLSYGPASWAAAPNLSSDLSPLDFIVGSWTSDSGRVEGDHDVRGAFVIEPAVGGCALLRRDHSEILDAGGKVAQSFEQIMLIYPDAGRLRADYFDGSHAIHYVDVEISAGRRVVFRSAALPSTPTFQLTYEVQAGGHLGGRFEVKTPGQTDYHLIATGTAKRSSLKD